MGGGASSESKQPDWLQLPDELLELILRRFTKLKDFLSFQAVCKPWRQAAATFVQGSDQPPGKFRQSLPWIMRPCDDSNDSHGPNCRLFIDVENNNNNNNVVAIRHMNIAGDDPSGYAPIGSSFGWLLRATKHHDSLFLFNPFTGNQIPLPATTSKLRRHHVYGFAMSAEPTTTKPEGCMVIVHCMIMGDFRCCLMFCKIGDQGWRFSLSVERIMDIVFWKGKFYGVSAYGAILVCDAVSGVSCVFCPRIDMKSSFSARVCDRYYFLVSPDGELVMVARSCTSNICTYKVYRIDIDLKTKDEIVITGDYALFLDSDKAVYVSVKDHTECKGNSIHLYSRRDDCVWIMPSNY